MLNLKLSFTEWFKGWPSIIMLTLMACSSFDSLTLEEGQTAADSMEQTVWQITNDVNSVEDKTYVNEVVYTDELEDVGHFWIVDGNTRTDRHTTVEIWSFRYDSSFECIYSEDVDVAHSTLFNINGDGEESMMDLIRSVQWYRRVNIHNHHT